VSAAGPRCRCHSGCVALLAGAAIALAWPPAAAPASSGDTGGAGSPRAAMSVLGGGSTSIERLPFQVALYDPAAGSPAAGFFCGGVIVDATHVITAAHCLASARTRAGAAAPGIAALAGSTRLDQPDPGSVRDPAKAVSVDPRYNPATDDYDIGVVTLARPLWQSAVAPSADGESAIAPLPIDVAAAARYGDPNANPATLATVSGWGDTNPAPSGPPSYPNVLQATRVPLVSDALCTTEYAAIEVAITSRMICAGGASPRADSCYGDSGGPLLVNRETQANAPADYVLVGLVGFGEGCGQPGFAGVYTRIASPAIARYLASGVGRRAHAAALPPDREKKLGSKRHHHMRNHKRRHSGRRHNGRGHRRARG
jgi:secreted trypsin-like serine protease